MKKTFISIVMALLIVTVMASCKDKPDASLLPTPEIEFRAVKGVTATEFMIKVHNSDKLLDGVSYATVVRYTVADPDGNVLYTDSAQTSAEGKDGRRGTVDWGEAGDTLVCTVTFDYYGHTTSTTVSDVIM